MRHQLRAVALAVHRHTGGERNFSEMIPREILNKIRQIELRTNRLVSESLGERARLGRSQRRPRRWHERTRDSRAFSNLLAHEGRREREPNGSRDGGVPPILFQPMAHFQWCASRFSIPVKTVSAGIPECGF